MTTCLICGCSNDAACMDDDIQPCHWIAVSDDQMKGVCSQPSCIAAARAHGWIEDEDESDDLLVPSRELILPGDAGADEMDAAVLAAKNMPPLPPSQEDRPEDDPPSG